MVEKVQTREKAQSKSPTENKAELTDDQMKDVVGGAGDYFLQLEPPPPPEPKGSGG